MYKTLAVVLATFLFPVSAHAASLHVSPASGSYEIGQTVTVTLYAESTQALNAVSGTLSVPADAFQILSVSNTGTIVDFWSQDPKAVGGGVTFEGVVLNPGYTGSAGKIASVLLKVKRTGTLTLSYQNASVLANDGKGTNILTGTRGGSFTGTEAAPPKPIEPRSVEPEVIAPEPVAEPEPVHAPMLTDMLMLITSWLLALLSFFFAGLVAFLFLRKERESKNLVRDAERSLRRSFSIMRDNIAKEQSFLAGRKGAAAEREEDLLETLQENINTTEERVEDKLDKARESK